MLSAFAAWLRLSSGAGLDGVALAHHPLTKAAMEGLKSVDTFEDASDAVCELVMCTASRGQPEPQMMPLVQLLVPAVSHLLSYALLILTLLSAYRRMPITRCGKISSALFSLALCPLPSPTSFSLQPCKQLFPLS